MLYIYKKEKLAERKRKLFTIVIITPMKKLYRTSRDLRWWSDVGSSYLIDSTRREKKNENVLSRRITCTARRRRRFVLRFVWRAIFRFVLKTSKSQWGGHQAKNSSAERLVFHKSFNTKSARESSRFYSAFPPPR